MVDRILVRKTAHQRVRANMKAVCLTVALYLVLVAIPDLITTPFVERMQPFIAQAINQMGAGHLDAQVLQTLTEVQVHSLLVSVVVFMVTFPLGAAQSGYFLDLYREGTAHPPQSLFSVFQGGRFFRILACGLWMLLSILAWSLLFGIVVSLASSLIISLFSTQAVAILLMLAIIAGTVVLLIWLGIRYMAQPYFLWRAQRPSPRRSLFVAKQIVKGHYMDAFSMRLSLIGWYLLAGVPTILYNTMRGDGANPWVAAVLGILPALYVYPYIETVVAGFVEGLRQEAIAGGRLTEEDFR